MVGRKKETSRGIRTSLSGVEVKVKVKVKVKKNLIV